MQTTTRPTAKTTRKPAFARLARQAAIEMLENRQLFAASFVAQIPNANGSPSEPSTINLPNFFTTERTVRLTVPTGTIDINTLNSLVPINANNFIRYVQAGRYDGTIFERFVDGFVLQGGSQKADGTRVESFGTIASEPNGDRHNTRGTVAFARVGPDDGGGPDTATSAFFFNLADNSANLDAQNGGFTVFGNVQGDGMTVVDALAQLPSTSRVINSAIVVPDLTYQIINSNPDQVSATVNGDFLTVSYLAPNATSTITVRATDTLGTVVDNTFVATAAGIDVQLGGTSGNKSFTYTQADGTVSTFSLKGAGAGTFSLSGAGLTQTQGKGKLTVVGAATLSSATFTGTDTSTGLSISSKNGVTTLGKLTSDGSFKSISGSKTALAGTLTITGTVQSISLASAASSSITVGGVTTDKATTYSFGDVSDLGVTSATPIKSIKVKSAIDAGGSAETISAPSIGSITSSGDFGIGISMATGDLGSLKVGGALSGTSTIHSIKSVSVKRDFLGSIRIEHAASEAVDPNAKAQQGIQSVKVGGNFSGSILSASTIGSFSSTSASGGLLVAGEPDVSRIPTAASEIVEPAAILSLKVSKTFASTFVIARSIGKASVGTITAGTGSSTFGFYATAYGSLKTKTDTGVKISLKNPPDQATIDAALGGATIGDLNIKLLT